jgi:hypothetical protein
MTDTDQLNAATNEAFAVADRIISFVNNGGHLSERGQRKLDELTAEMARCINCARTAQEDISWAEAGASR